MSLVSPIAIADVENPSKTRQNKARFSIELPSAVDAQLEALAAEKGVTKTEMIRIAVRAMANIHDLEKEGFRNSSMKVNADGSKESVRIMF